jgi:hypothetical protein
MAKKASVETLRPGETIRTVRNGKIVTVKLLGLGNISLWPPEPDVILSVEHTVGNVTRETIISLDDLHQWVRETEWEKVTTPPGADI